MSSFLSPRSLEAKQVLNSPFGISGQLLLRGGFNNSVFRLCLLPLFICFISIKVNLQNLMFVLSSWHYFKLQFFYNYNLLRRVLPSLTQTMSAMECQIMSFRTSYLYYPRHYFNL